MQVVKRNQFFSFFIDIITVDNKFSLENTPRESFSPVSRSKIVHTFELKYKRFYCSDSFIYTDMLPGSSYQKL